MNKVTVKKIILSNGCDCCGMPDYDKYYVVEGENGEVIYKSKSDPTDLINYLTLLEPEVDRPIKTLGELVTQFCCLTECKICPVVLHGYEKRTEYEKTMLHEPCCSNLYKWIIEQSC